MVVYHSKQHFHLKRENIVSTFFIIVSPVKHEGHIGIEIMSSSTSAAVSCISFIYSLNKSKAW